MFSSPLRRAIARGMKPNGDLADELRRLGEYTLRSAKDAKAICNALKALPPPPPGTLSFASPLHALAGLFQDVESRDAPAFNVLYTEGLPQLIRVFDREIERVSDKEGDDLLLVLKVLGMYGSREGAEKVVEAARRPFKPDAYLWHVILSAFSEGHPFRDYLFDSLSNPLPSGFLAVALLDAANAAALNGERRRHPFDTPAGWKRLQAWLEDDYPEHFSYARSATAALPFLSDRTRDRLLALALDHVDAGVQIEAAWAAGKLGREAGLRILARWCLDVNQSEMAQRYLAELGREDLCPAEVQEPSFQAKAEFAQWLSHPNELGRAPDELEIVDHRPLEWPPDREPKPFWLIRYRLRDRHGLKEDDVDCGLVGSMTWCFFSYKLHERPPEDAYAIHCYWEMEQVGLIADEEVSNAAEYAGMLAQWQGLPLQAPRITQVAELSPELKLPGRLVALASATLDGAEGWVVFDGPRSTWYPKAEQPAETGGSVVLMIHVGRQLLGFRNQPDRKQRLITNRPPRDVRQFVAAYEKLIAEAASAEPKRQETLLSGWQSPFSKHFDEYVDALVSVKGAPKAGVLIEVYRRFLELAQQADASLRDETLGTHSIVGEQFDAYVDALISCNRSSEIAELIQLLAPYWDNVLGCMRFGGAAFKAGLREIAERYLLKLRETMERYYCTEEMDMLAELWHNRGESPRARELLVDCMRKCIGEIRESRFASDRERLGDRFRHHRSTYLRLLPNSDGELARLGLPAEPPP